MIISIAIGVAFGMLAAGAISMGVIMSERFLGWYTKKITKMTTAILNEQMKNLG